MMTSTKALLLLLALLATLVAAQRFSYEEFEDENTFGNSFAEDDLNNLEFSSSASTMQYDQQAENDSDLDDDFNENDGEDYDVLSDSEHVATVQAASKKYADEVPPEQQQHIAAQEDAAITTNFANVLSHAAPFAKPTESYGPEEVTSEFIM